MRSDEQTGTLAPEAVDGTRIVGWNALGHITGRQELHRFILKPATDGRIIADEGVVEAVGYPDCLEVSSIRATWLAEELGRRLVMNMVVAGFFTAVTGLVSADAMRRAVETSVPRGTEKLNLRAFERGYQFGLAKVTG